MRFQEEFKHYNDYLKNIYYVIGIMIYYRYFYQTINHCLNANSHPQSRTARNLL